MSMQPISGDILKGVGARRTEESRGAGPRVPLTSPVQRAERADRVEISQEGRAQAMKAARGEGGVSPLGSERLDNIRARIDDGTYDQPEVLEQVARKLLSSGDLGL
ncbi:MAG: flagellar biosynthesis anti-sigma factor FlgM [Gemmatimonadales bacterium]|nr:MAG: flagellar biosynthesis anti-sigma factor FlgM [Gemmatimonadales bacterium]